MSWLDRLTPEQLLKAKLMAEQTMLIAMNPTMEMPDQRRIDLAILILDYERT